MNTDTSFLGVTVYSEYIINEGVDRVLDNLTTRAAANAVAINPSVATKSTDGIGTYEPPDDAGSSPRLLDRPLWGEHGLWIRGAPSYHPDESLYADSPYKPGQPNELTDELGHIIDDFIDGALARGFKVYFQVSASCPPTTGATASPTFGMSRGEDLPHLPDGRITENPMANTTCLASDAIRSYLSALVGDLLQAYPRITGFRPDWPEYPCYKLDEAFHDFSPHVRMWATSRGWDFEDIRRDVAALYDHLHGGLTNDELEEFAGIDRGRVTQIALLRRYPGVFEWLRLKAALSVDLLAHWRSAILEAGGVDKELSANAFVPPFSLFTGFDFAGAGTHCDAVTPKLFTMHWAQMVSFWGEVLLSRNAGLREELVVQALANLFDLGDDIQATKLSEYHYPEPDEPHPIPTETQARKIRQAIAQTDGRAAVTPMVHGYGPHDDFVRRFRLAAESPADGIWVNRYGYLSDAKLDAIGSVWRSLRS